MWRDFHEQNGVFDRLPYLSEKQDRITCNRHYAALLLEETAVIPWIHKNAPHSESMHTLMEFFDLVRS